MALQFPTRAEWGSGQPHIASLSDRLWPEYLYHVPVLDRFFGRVISEYAEFQLRLGRRARGGRRRRQRGAGDMGEWTELTFPEGGSYVVPGGLVPVEIDRERDEGLYVEPNVWMVHPSTAG
jgi:hypothetical protein